jgi:peptide/nickel transport system ATP-binding protein
MEMHKKSNTGIIIVTHNLGIAVYMSDRIIVMKDGLIVEEGDRNRILKNPADEYTRKLIKSVPVFDGESYV